MTYAPNEAGCGYVPLALPATSDEHAKLFFDVLDSGFADMHQLLVFRRALAGKPVGYRWATPLALMALTDTCANLFWTGPKATKGREKFKTFIVNDYRWKLDQPEHITASEIADLLWNRLRGPLVHRLGLKGTHRRIDDVVFSEMAVLSTAELGEIERGSERPWQASVSRDLRTARVTVQMEGWYWGLRKSVESLLGDSARLEHVVSRLRTGDFDPDKPCLPAT